jgi:hypothetical protein
VKPIFKITRTKRVEGVAQVVEYPPRSPEFKLGWQKRKEVFKSIIKRQITQFKN